MSLARTVDRSGREYRVQRRVLKQCVNPSGYLVVSVSRNGRTRAVPVHRLVAEAFHGVRPEALETRHLDGDKRNNAPANLRYGTHSENTLDTVAHGHNRNANKTHCPAGHAYAVHGRYRPKYRDRVCRECRNLAERKRYRARRAR